MFYRLLLEPTTRVNSYLQELRTQLI